MVKVSRRSAASGFTLLEVLIASVILSLIIFLATVSYSTFLSVWQSEYLADSQRLEDYRRHSLLRRSLEAVNDYFVTDPANERAAVFYPYFRGRADKIEFVTLASVFAKHAPAAARLSVKPQKEGNGAGKYLLYEELPLDETYIKYADSTPAYENRLVPYRGFKDARIRYFGLQETKWIPEAESFRRVNGWQEEFDAQARNCVPEIIEITLVREEGETRLLFAVRGQNLFKQSFLSSEF